jgi:hypothetical protein
MDPSDPLELFPDVKQQDLSPTFGPQFLQHHAGAILTDPRYAIIELVANCWDAGADRVDITWPAAIGDQLAIADNGGGMTAAEFAHRWTQFNYDRIARQGVDVEFPPGRQRRARRAFGRNGIGRHAMFCFATHYRIRSAKNGFAFTAIVTRSPAGAQPFTIAFEGQERSADVGTTVSALTEVPTLSATDVTALIGSRFVSDPEFAIFVNDAPITLTSLESVSETFELSVPDVGTIIVRRFDTDLPGRTSQQHGVAWWTNHRSVGTPSWDIPGGGALLDARSAPGRRLTYVVEADTLLEFVKPDWSGYRAAKRVIDAQKAVYTHIRGDLHRFLAESRRDRKREALRANREALIRLPTASREQVAQFAEKIQVQSPTMSERDLENAVGLLAKLESARTGYDLLARLATLAPNDLDSLNQILAEWTVSDAKTVLDELRFRLELIARLEKLVESRDADELHDLQPLFERGLWIFGPHFEAVSFTSNQTLATVVQTFFGTAELTTPRKRPDFVVLPDSSIGVYAADAFDINHEIDGFDAVVIVELKRGGFRLTHQEKDQAMGYARELRRSGKVKPTTMITCYVLATEIDPSAHDEMHEGETIVLPQTYQTVLRKAHARTFNLLQRVKASVPADSAGDPDLREVLDPAQGELNLRTDAA